MEKRILELSYNNKLSHIGSNLTAVNIIDEIYKKKKPNEKFVLSSGHAHLAHLVVMEKYGKKIGDIHDIHCNLKDGCDVATGSLGQGLPIAVGMALANRKKNVYCLITDGECSEGSMWEALRIADEQILENLKVYCNINGYGAYKKLGIDTLINRLASFFPVRVFTTQFPSWPFVKDPQDYHYHVLTKEEYEKTR